MSTVADELPYAATVSNDLLDCVCSGCFLRISHLKRCSKCKILRYCSPQCQKDDWTEHKDECPRLCAVAPKVPTSMARLLARIIFRRNSERNGAAPSSAFNGRTLDRLMDHKDELQKDSLRCDFFLCLSQILYQYIGPELLRPVSELMSLFGKVVVNCFTIMDDNLNSIGTGLYLGLSAHDHSCRPDAFVLYSGKKALLRVSNPEAVYSQALRISYTDLMQHTARRRAELMEQYYFLCDCILCGDVHRDCLARSVRCLGCPGVCPLDEDASQLVCNECGSPQKLAVHEAVHANQQLEWELRRSEASDKEDKDIKSQLEDTILKYEKFAQILSPLNMALAVYAQRILSGAFQLGRTDLLQKYAFVSIRAYREYLPVGHPELSIRYHLAAQAAASADPPTPNVLAVIEEARETMMVSHGPRHHLSAELESMRSNYKSRLQTFLYSS